jgi:predicted anti-sigma-YlaC factor YlaD
MECEACRTALSARLDGEESGVPAAEPAAHVAGCAECRDWLSAAERLRRIVSVAPAEPVPDLTDRILVAHVGRPAGKEGLGIVRQKRFDDP